jgi:hypothetical protein
VRAWIRPLLDAATAACLSVDLLACLFGFGFGRAHESTGISAMSSARIRSRSNPHLRFAWRARERMHAHGG